jgi:pimeloyl-ACP methyl ester carboxylesterase
MVEPQTHTIGEYKLFVEEYKPDEISFPRPVVLVHGSFGGGFMWKMIAPMLATNGMHAFVPTLRGHGMSAELDLGQVSMQDYVDDVQETVNHFSLKNPIIIGHSMAGLVALMYGAQHGASAIIAIDPSQSKEVQGDLVDKNVIRGIPDIYDAMDAGMPSTPEGMAEAMPDIPSEVLMQMPEMLGQESGKARKERKLGISVPKDKMSMPLLFIGAEKGSSLLFGISIEKTRAMAKYYNSPIIEIEGATHPGIIMGTNTPKTTEAILKWLQNIFK